MAIPSKCRKCGYEFHSNLIQFGPGVVHANVTIGANIENCPNCGGIADVQSGSYQFVGGVLKVFAAPSMSRKKVASVRDIASKASSGDLSTSEAIEQLTAVSAELANVIRSTESKKVNWELLLAILVFIYSWWSDQASDDAAQAALAEARTQTEVAQKMLEVLEEQHDLDSANMIPKPTQLQGRKLKPPGPTNRADRRKVRSIAKRAEKKK